MSLFIVCVSLLYIVHMAVAASTNTGTESLSEHSVALLDIAAYAIVVLASGLVALVLWNIKDLKQSHRESTSHLEDVIRDVKKRSDNTEQLLLSTRQMLLELHAEHGIMMDRCSRKHEAAK